MRLYRHFALAYAAVLGGGCLYGLMHFRHWPLSPDAAIFHYIAWRIETGAVPYRDIFDMNMPGTYLLHLACLKWFGDGDAAFRAFDLTFCLAAAGMVALACRKQSPIGAVAAGLFFVAYHLAQDPFYLGERDFLMTPCLLLAAFVFMRALEKPENPWRFFIVGLLSGCLLWIKPVALAFPILCCFAVLRISQPRRNRLSAVAIMGAGLLLPVILMLGWLARRGGLADFYTTVFSFTLPIYARLGGIDAPLLVLATTDALILAGLLFGLYRCTGKTLSDSQKTVTAILLLYGFLHFYLQTKGSAYHAYPLWAAYAWFFGMALPGLRFRKQQDTLWAYALTLFLCILVSPLDHLFSDHYQPFEVGVAQDEKDRTALTDSMEKAFAGLPAALVRRYAPDGTISGHIQCFDSTFAQTWNVLYRQHWLPVSRHLQAYPLYRSLDARFAAVDNPYILQLSHELYASFEKKPPLLIVLSVQTFPYLHKTIFKMIDADPLWRDFFAGHYRIAADTRRYRLYVRKD